MIFDAIIGILTAILTGLLALLPAYVLPADFTEVGATLGSALASAGIYFPVGTLGFCIAAVVGVRVFVSVVGVIAWVYDKIPGKLT